MYSSTASRRIDVRTALNLKDNEGNLGKAVVIKGQLTKYFGVAGLKNTPAAVFDGKDIGDGGDTPSGDLASLLDPSNPVAEELILLLML